MEHFEKMKDSNFLKPESIISDFSSEKISQYHIDTKISYVNTFKSSLFEEAEPVGISSGVDSSTVWIGSTISVFKPLLETGSIPEKGLVLIQPCLRTQNKRHLYDDEDIDYNTFFTTLGGISPIEKIDDVYSVIMDFLKKVGISDDRILVRLKSTDIDLIESLSSEPKVHIEEDAKDKSYYKWQYGMADFDGRGLTIAIKNKNSNNFEDIGNIIVVDKKGVPCAVQWGFGIETLLARIYSRQKPIECSLISQVVEFKSGSQSKFLDALSAVIEMYLSGIIKPNNKGAGSQLRDYLKGLSYLKRKQGYSNEDLTGFTKKYLILKDFNKDTGIIDKMIDYIEKHEQKIVAFKKIITDMKLQKTSTEIEAMLNNTNTRNSWSQQYGINIYEMKEIIKNN